MSKAFDTVIRNNLMELLTTILDSDETHMMKILLKYIYKIECKNRKRIW